MKKRLEEGLPVSDNKKAQVTVFVIIAISLIVLIIILYYFYPSIKSSLDFSEKNPVQVLQECLEDKIQEAASTAAKQGGSINPGFYYNYNNTKIEYLCYTEEYYKTCVMQQPMLKRHIENEIKNVIRDEAEGCMSFLKESFEKKGYSVSLNRGVMEVELLPKIIAVTFSNSSISLSKGEEAAKKYENLKVIVNNNLYELIGIANSILNWEARYGDAETTVYMNYYHDLKVEKKKQSDGTTIYILTDRNTGDVLQFASRSVAWPAGYGADKVYGV